jgi:hypothetical protein
MGFPLCLHLDEIKCGEADRGRNTWFREWGPEVLVGTKSAAPNRPQVSADGPNAWFGCGCR